MIKDDRALCENTEELLELSSYAVITAPNGKIGIETAKVKLPDIIVCDIMTPEVDGYMILENLSAEGKTKHIPFIFLSAKNDEPIKISRNDLASVAAIATESLIRTLSGFKKEGLIDIEGRNLKINQ